MPGRRHIMQKKNKKKERGGGEGGLSEKVKTINILNQFLTSEFNCQDKNFDVIS